MTVYDKGGGARRVVAVPHPNLITRTPRGKIPKNLLPARLLKKRGGKARAYIRGKVIIAAQSGIGFGIRKGQVLYILSPSVRIPIRAKVISTAKRETVLQFQPKLERAIERVVSGRLKRRSSRVS
jgi:hypothetical protein